VTGADESIKDETQSPSRSQAPSTPSRSTTPAAATDTTSSPSVATRADLSRIIPELTPKALETLETIAIPHAFYDLSYREIAEARGVTVALVSLRMGELQREIERIADALEGDTR
jgi:DNA-directed RNA polymerase specialized sigma24 family protein